MTCGSCGADESEPTSVHRTYVTPGTRDQTAGERILDDVEHWCFACLTQSPHEPAGA